MDYKISLIKGIIMQTKLNNTFDFKEKLIL